MTVGKDNVFIYTRHGVRNSRGATDDAHQSFESSKEGDDDGEERCDSRYTCRNVSVMCCPECGVAGDVCSSRHREVHSDKSCQ